jgi:hypothetical protein
VPPSSTVVPPRSAPARALRTTLLCVGAALGLGSGRAAEAQPVLGIGENAVVLPRGVLRVGLGGELSLFDERYSSDAGGAALGTVVPFRGELAGTLGAGQLGLVGQLESRVRALTEQPGLTLALGELAPRATARRITVPLRLELGVGGRLQLSATVPYVQTRVVVFPDVTPTGNVGLNPAIADAELAARTTALLSQFEAASGQLAAALAACGADPASSPACSDPDAALSTDAAAQAFASALAALYLPEAGGSPLVPVAGSDAAAAIAQRIADYRAAYVELGVTAIGEGTGPAHAAPPTASDVQRLLQEPAFGLGYAPFRSRSRYGIGDVEVGAKLMLLDGFGADPAIASAITPGVRLRAAMTALVRLGTATTDDPDDLVDIGIGDGQHDLELGVVGDLAIGRAFVSAAARYGVQLADQVELRVPTAVGEALVPAAQRALVDRDLGDYLELELTPRMSIGEFISVGAQYRYRSKASDAYTLPGTGAVDALATGTEAYEHRAGLGITLSTLSAWARGRIGAPMDVSYLHSRVVAGGGALTNRAARDEVAVRLYLGLFGRH